MADRARVSTTPQPWFALFAVVLAAACSEPSKGVPVGAGGGAPSGSSSGAGPAGMYDPATLGTPESLCAASIDAMCVGMVACGSAVDMATCVGSIKAMRLRTRCLAIADVYRQWAQSGALVHDAVGTADCLAEAAAACGGPSALACFRMNQEPRLNLGAPCLFDEHCKSGKCGASGQQCPGVCGKGHASVADWWCTHDSECPAGKACRNHDCRTRGAALGEACGSGVFCEKGVCSAGTCVKESSLLGACPKHPGDSCRVDFVKCDGGSGRADAGSLPQDGGARPVDAGALPEDAGSSGSCYVRYTVYAALGNECNGVVDSTQGIPIVPIRGNPIHRLCKLGLRCDSDTGKCAAPLAEGAKCGTDEDCGPGRFCSHADDTCKAPAALGAPCEQDCMPPGWCFKDTKTCVIPTSPGQPCTSASMCIDRPCVAGQCPLLCG